MAGSSAVEASYLADNMVSLRYFEFKGEVRQAVSVFKKRGSDHERTIREFSIGAGGIRDEADLRLAEQAGAAAWLTASALHDRRLAPRAD